MTRLLGGAGRAVNGRVLLDTPRGPFAADFLICGTGTRMDASSVPLLAHCADNLATWGDRFAPPEGEGDERLLRFPYLDANSAFTEREAGRTPWIRDIHLFGFGTTLSFGPAGASINAMAIAAPRLAAGVTRGLFAADMPRLLDELLAYDLPQVTLDPTRIAADRDRKAQHFPQAQGKPPQPHRLVRLPQTPPET